MTTATLSSTTAASPTFNAPTPTSVPETLTFSVTVKDENGGTGFKTATGTVSVTVNNRPPVANAGSDTTGGQGATVRLDGRNSSDPDSGDTLSYSWVHDTTHTDNTYDTAVTLSSANTSRPWFTVPDVKIGGNNATNVLVFKLTVSDGTVSRTDTVKVTATNTAPTASISAANVTAGNPYSPSVTASDADDNNSELKYSWSVTGTPTATVTNAMTATPSIAIPSTASLNATYTLSVTVSDEDGGSVTASATLTVNNRAPTAKAAGTNYGTALTTRYLAAGSSSDPDPGEAATLKCSWKKVGGTYTKAVTIQYPTDCSSARFTVPSDAATGSTIVFALTVTDAKGGTDTTLGTDPSGEQPHAFVVGTAPPPANTTPTANAGADQNFKMGLNNNTVNLTGSGSDPDSGDTLAYFWSKVSGTYSNLITLGSTNTEPHKAQFTWPSQAPVGHSFTLKLSVCDQRGACDDDTVRVTRKNAKPVPSAANQTFSQKRTGTVASVSITGSGTDADGHTPLTFWWIQATKPNSTEYAGTYGKDIALTSENNLGVVSGASVTATMPQCIGSNAIKHGETIVLRLSARDSYSINPQIGTHDVTITADFLKRTDGNTNAAPTFGQLDVRLTLTGGTSAETLDARPLVSDDASSDANMVFTWELTGGADGIADGFTLTTNNSPTTGAAATLGVGTAGAGTYTNALRLTVMDEDCMTAVKYYDIGVTSN